MKELNLFMLVWKWNSLFVFFMKEVIVANLQIAQLVLVKPASIEPALIEFPLEVKSDLGIFLLSSMITLTPGTLSLHVSKDRRFLYVHVTHATDVNAVIASIKDGFEKKLLEVGC